MKRLLFVLLIAFPLFAADVEVGVDHVITIMHGDPKFDGGELEVRTSRGFTASAEMFFSPRVSTRFTAMFINPVAFVNDIDLNTLGMDIYGASARYHFEPRAHFSPFVGAGVAYVSFGNLEERFADDIEMEVDARTTFFAEGGVRYQFYPRLFFHGTVTYMPLEGDVRVIHNARPDVALPRQIELNPMTISAGASWRF
jgi:outer membrane protein W